MKEKFSLLRKIQVTGKIKLNLSHTNDNLEVYKVSKFYHFDIIFLFLFPWRGGKINKFLLTQLLTCSN